jgi:hypothetical protein
LAYAGGRLRGGICCEDAQWWRVHGMSSAERTVIGLHATAEAGP